MAADVALSGPHLLCTCDKVFEKQSLRVQVRAVVTVGGQIVRVSSSFFSSFIPTVLHSISRKGLEIRSLTQPWVVIVHFLSCIL